MHLPQHKLCTRKTVLALEVKFYLDIDWISMAMATNADQLNDVKYVFGKHDHVSNVAATMCPRFAWTDELWTALEFVSLCRKIPRWPGTAEMHLWRHLCTVDQRSSPYSHITPSLTSSANSVYPNVSSLTTSVARILVYWSLYNRRFPSQVAG